MKCMKHILILLLVLFIAVAMEAQENYNPKRTLKEVKAQLKAEKYQQAEDILNKAMNEHKEAKSKPEFHYLRLQALRGLATAENRNMFLNTRPDTAKYFTYINRIYEYGFSCDSLDRLPNEKGKVRPSYTSSIVNMLAAYRNNIKSGGKYYYKKNKYDDAYRFFDLYLSTLHHPLITAAKDYKVDDDTLSIARLAVFSAYNAAKHPNVMKYLPMAMKDTVDYALLCQIGSTSLMTMKDTIQALDYLHKGWEADPLQEFFYVHLIDYHVEHEEYSKAIDIIDKQLEVEPQKRLLWFVKGKCEQCIDSVDLAIECYQKAIECQPDDALSYSSIGGIYIDKAREVYDISNFQPGTSAFTRVKKQQSQIYEKAKSALENARKYAPNDETLWHDGLMEAYFKLNLGKELKELETLAATPASDPKSESSNPNEKAESSHSNEKAEPANTKRNERRNTR